MPAGSTIADLLEDCARRPVDRWLAQLMDRTLRGSRQSQSVEMRAKTRAARAMAGAGGSRYYGRS